MRLNREAQGIYRDFEFYDSGIMGVLPRSTFDLFEILRRWVWRSMEVGDPISRRLRREGKLATKMSQAQIGEYLNQTRKNVNGYIKIMKELGWVEVIQDPDGGMAVYVLGEVHKDQEFFFADRWMQGLGDLLKVAAKDFKPNGRIIDLPWETRRTICSDYIAREIGSEESTESDLSDSGSPARVLRLVGNS